MTQMEPSSSRASGCCCWRHCCSAMGNLTAMELRRMTMVSLGDPAAGVVEKMAVTTSGTEHRQISIIKGIHLPTSEAHICPKSEAHILTKSEALKIKSSQNQRHSIFKLQSIHLFKFKSTHFFLKFKGTHFSNSKTLSFQIRKYLFFKFKRIHFWNSKALILSPCDYSDALLLMFYAHYGAAFTAAFV